MPFKFLDNYLNEAEPENMGGFDSVSFICPSRNIKTWPKLAKNPTTDQEVAVYTGSFECVQGEGFIQVYSTPGKTGYAAESQGDTDGKSFAIKGTLFQPSLGVEPIALARKINNAHGVIIMTDGENNRYAVGTRGRPARFSASANAGNTAADPKGITIEFECDSHLPGTRYDGPIPLIGGDEIPSIDDDPEPDPIDNQEPDDD